MGCDSTTASVLLVVSILMLAGAIFWSYRAKRSVAGCEEENEKLQQKIDEIRTIDEVTGAFNYQAFVKSTYIQLRLSHRHNWPVSMLLIDIIDLERINFKHGYKAGNTVLKATAEAIFKAVRTSDVVGRFEGSRFFVFLQECKEEDAPKALKRVVENLQEAPPVLNDKIIDYDLRASSISGVGKHAYLQEMIDGVVKGIETAKKEGEKFVKVKMTQPESAS